MHIVGCDFHPGWQQVAVLDTETGEIQEHKLENSSGEAERFLPATITPCRYFPRLRKFLIYNPRDVNRTRLVQCLSPVGIVGLLFQLAVFVIDTQVRQPAVAHWPWWLRILAVVGVIVFIRIAVTFARNSSRPQ